MLQSLRRDGHGSTVFAYPDLKRFERKGTCDAADEEYAGVAGRHAVRRWHAYEIYPELDSR